MASICVQKVKADQFAAPQWYDRIRCSLFTRNGWDTKIIQTAPHIPVKHNTHSIAQTPAVLCTGSAASCTIPVPWYNASAEEMLFSPIATH